MTLDVCENVLFFDIMQCWFDEKASWWYIKKRGSARTFGHLHKFFFVLKGRKTATVGRTGRSFFFSSTYKGRKERQQLCRLLLLRMQQQQ